MLQNIRDNSRGIISYILIGILVLFFAISGIEALFNWNMNADEAASVNGEKITKISLERAIANQKQQMINTYGNDIPAEFISDDYLRKPVLENLIRREVLLQNAKAMGLAVSQEELMRQIAAEPGFKDEKGVFDNQKYQQILGMMGLTHSDYLKLLSEDQLISQLQTAWSTSAFTLPYEIDNLVALNFQSRDIQYFTIPIGQTRDSITVSDEEIASEYNANPQTYTAEEQVAVDYLELSSADLMKGLTVTEEQVRSQYDQFVANFVATPEKQAAHILIEGDKPDLVKQVADKIAAGEDFASLAKTYSEDLGSKEQGGDLGYTSSGTFPAEFEDALAKLKVGEVSTAVKTDAGTHFIKLIAERGSQAPSFEEQRAVIEEQLKRTEAENLFVAKLETLKEETYNAEKLADVAPNLGLTVKNTGLFARNSGKDIAANPKFVEAAFSSDVLQEGNASEPVEVEPLHVVVVKKTEHQPKHLKSLDEVKEQILATLKDKKARLLIAEKARDYVNQLQAGKTFVEVAKSSGSELKEFKAVKRGNPEVDMEVLRTAFSMAKPTADKNSISGAPLSNGDYAVIVVSGVSSGDKSQIPAEQQTAIFSQLSNLTGQQTFDSFQKALEEKAEIERKM
jgi:peptidyl-prolyl cis-trans isomerase D